MTKNIYVGNLPFSTDDQELENVFAEYGEISSAKVIKDRFTNRSRGFGFVEMENEEEADKAIEELNGSSLEGRTLKVDEAKPKRR
ncbi:MAG: RNA-binding protein [Candidatus Latescibacteria bacterium]|jgi:RNA recognition motif-containing protein|nr:RNA-binding protein [bacterium]MBD3424386.1 RNA-binding protein [Candidatus Latescibacterota bacterium]